MTMQGLIWRRPIAGLTAKQAAATATYQRARSHGYGIADALAQARGAEAYRQSALATIRESKKRSAAARRGWKARQQGWRSR